MKFSKIVLAIICMVVAPVSPAQDGLGGGHGAESRNMRLAGGGHGAESRNMRLAGMSDLQGRSAFQVVIAKQGERWIAYVGTHGGGAMNPLTGQEEGNGTIILDVSDARQPRIVHHIPTASKKAVEGGEGTGAQMVQVCAGKDLPRGDPAKAYMMRTDGSRAHEMWDVTVPERPVKITDIVADLRSTHRQAWECDAHRREQGARDVGRHRARAPGQDYRYRCGSPFHSPPGVGMRYRHRLRQFRPARLGGAAHDAGVGPLGSREAGARSRLRIARPAARRAEAGESPVARRPRAVLDGTEGQPAVLRLRQRRQRRVPDRRPRETAQRAEGADPGEPAISATFVPGDRHHAGRARGAAADRDGDSGIFPLYQGQGP